MSFWTHTHFARLGTWLAHLLMMVGGLCMKRGRIARPCRGRSRISRVAAFRELRAGCAGCAGSVHVQAPGGAQPSEGAGRAARVVADGDGRGAVAPARSQAPGCPQPWRVSAAAPSTVVGRGPACEAVHELRAGTAGDERTLSPLRSSHPSPSPPRRRGSIHRARAVWDGVHGAWVKGDGSTAGPTRRFTPSTRREAVGWIPACAGMTKGAGMTQKMEGRVLEGGLRLV